MLKKKQKKGTLILTIGSTQVSASVSYTNKNTLVLERTHKEPVGAGSKETRDNLEKQMLIVLDTLLKKYAGEAYSDVRIILDSPWHEARIRTIHSKAEKPKNISMAGVEKIIEQYKNETPPKSNNVDVEAVAVQVRVNDYITSLKNPVQGTRITINLYESEMQKTLNRNIGRLVQKHIPHARMTFNTFPLVSGVALRDTMVETSFIYADVGGEVTEIGVMHADGIHFLGSIPVGYWTIIRNMGGEEIGDTRSRMALWLKGELTMEESEAISGKFVKAFDPWLTELEDMLKEASTLVPVPRSLFLITDQEPAGWIQRGVEENGSMSIVPTIITPTITQRFIEVGEGGMFDVPLSLAALFFHIGELGVVGEPTPRKMVYSK